MVSNKISNVYRFKDKGRSNCFIYSVKSSNNQLGFEYFILAKNDENESNIYSIGNTLNVLETIDADIEPVTKNSEAYQTFIIDLFQTLHKDPKQDKKRTKRKRT